MIIFKTPQIAAVEATVLGKIDEIRSGLKHALRAPARWTGLLRRNLTAKAIQGSNTIEGYNITFEDAVAAVEGEQPTEASAETRAAILGYWNAMTYVLQRADDQHFAFNEELIRGLHYMMLSHDPNKHPGRWRPGPIFVRREPSKEIVYEGPDADLVPKLMSTFVEQVQTPDSSVHVIVRAAMSHLNLVMIHPFSDGNGRMGRCIQTLLLTRDGILAPPFSSIEEYLGSRGNTEAYYKVLGEVGAGSWHPERDARPWVRFCLTAHFHQALTVQRRLKEIAKLWDELETELKRRHLDERMIFALYDAAIGFTVRNPRYRAIAEVSIQIATRDLRALVHEGLLVPKGERRGRTYVASEVLTAIEKKTREARVPLEDPFKASQLPLPA